jgi:hypothetical protein
MTMSPTSPDAGGDAEGSLLDHLIELRARLLRAVSGLLLLFVALLPFANRLYAWLAQPLLEDAIGNRRIDRRATQFFREQPARREGHVADDFSIEPQPRLPPEEVVFRINGQAAALRRDGARLLVRSRGDHQLMQFLQTPTTVAKFDREPVKQLRMARR